MIIISEERKNIFLLAGLAILEALQVLVIVGHVCTFIPIRWNVPVPKGLEPERESFLYLLFLAAACAFFILSMMYVRPRLADQRSRKRWQQFAAMETGWTALFIFIFFKWVTYQYPFYNILPTENNHWLMPFFYACLVACMLSKVFFRELVIILGQARRWVDHVPMTSGRQVLAGIAGLTGIFVLLWPDARQVVALNYLTDQFNHWDQNSITGWLVKGGMDYTNLVMVLYVWHAGIWGLAFILLFRWLGSVFLAWAVVMLGIKFNLFHYGLAPAAWIYPDAIGIFHLPDWKAWQGFGNVAMFDALKVRQFFSYIAGYGIPLVYVGIVSWIFAFGKSIGRFDKRIATGLLAYGLITYANYIAVPKMFSYGAVIFPALVLMAWHLRMTIDRKMPKQRRVIYGILACLAMGSLLTNRLYAAYPHAVRLYGQNYQEQVDYVNRAFDLSTDAQMINALSAPDEPVAVLGSFELALLKQARRTSIFGLSPIMRSAQFMSPDVKGIRVMHKADLLAEIQKLRQRQPPYIFIERKIYALGQTVNQSSTGFGELFSFVNKHYQPSAQGKFYLALKRNVQP